MQPPQEMWEMQATGQGERRYLPVAESNRINASEDLHAWSIYRQNLNSDFTDSALGSAERSPLPYGNFQLRESTVASIMNNPRYGPKSELGNNMFTYLKFGLPRVFPPARNGRDASSGYDSSDDGSPIVNSRHRRYKRSKSDPDFRNSVIPKPTRSGGAASNVGNREEPWWGLEPKLRSNSEANLLSNDAYYYRERSGRESRAAQSDVAAKMARPGSKAGSQFSVASAHSRASKRNRTPAPAPGTNWQMGGFGVSMRPDGIYSTGAIPMLNDKFTRDGVMGGMLQSGMDGMMDGHFKHPHFQVLGLTYEVKQGDFTRRLLDSITFEVKGGEIMAVMVTDEREGTALLDVIANCHNKKSDGGCCGCGAKRHSLRGDFVVNGSTIRPTTLETRVSYVQRNIEFHPDMSVYQTLRFQAFLKAPGYAARGVDTNGRINALIKDLGLLAVRNTRTKDLTLSEKLRLNVAAHLLVDADIVLLDQPTKGMDIFDTFFLVEYLRQWALRGRIVLITLNPPTYEIFTMISKVALISTGRLMYYGKRREMLPYFAFIEFPCPAYKNPADYYLDLVTLDNLSAEAMLESSHRVEQLAETFRRRQDPLSDPGPRVVLPPKVNKAGFFTQIIALWLRASAYTFPYNLTQLAMRVLLAACLSVVIGVVWWDARKGPQEQHHANDRYGYHYAMMGVGIWPLLLLMMSDVWDAKTSVMRDIEDGLYSRGSFILSQTFYSVIPAGIVFVAYLMPAYVMSGIPNDSGDNLGLPIYLGHMLLYLFAMRSMVIAMAHLNCSRHTAGGIAGFLALLLVIPCGYPLHPSDIPQWSEWLRYVSPAKALLARIMIDEMSTVPTFNCSKSPVVPENNILVLADCGIDSGSRSLNFFGIDTELPQYEPYIISGAFIGVFTVLGMFLAACCPQRANRSRSRTEEM